MSKTCRRLQGGRWGAERNKAVSDNGELCPSNLLECLIPTLLSTIGCCSSSLRAVGNIGSFYFKSVWDVNSYRSNALQLYEQPSLTQKRQYRTLVVPIALLENKNMDFLCSSYVYFLLLNRNVFDYACVSLLWTEKLHCEYIVTELCSEYEPTFCSSCITWSFRWHWTGGIDVAFMLFCPFIVWCSCNLQIIASCLVWVLP